MSFPTKQECEAEIAKIEKQLQFRLDSLAATAKQNKANARAAARHESAPYKVALKFYAKAAKALGTDES